MGLSALIRGAPRRGSPPATQILTGEAERLSAPTIAGRAGSEARSGPSPLARSCGASFGRGRRYQPCPPSPRPGSPLHYGIFSPPVRGGGHGWARRGSAVLTFYRAPCSAAARPCVCRTLFSSPQFIPLPPARLKLFPYGKPLRSAVAAGRLRWQRGGSAGAPCSCRGKSPSRRDQARPAGSAPDLLERSSFGFLPNNEKCSQSSRRNRPGAGWAGDGFKLAETWDAQFSGREAAVNTRGLTPPDVTLVAT